MPGVPEKSGGGNAKPKHRIIHTGSKLQHISMILTLTVNPAIDRTITVDRLAFEDRTYILSSKDSPGGRGINAASVIHSFGGKTLAIFPAGGDRGARLE